MLGTACVLEVCSVAPCHERCGDHSARSYGYTGGGPCRLRGEDCSWPTTGLSLFKVPGCKQLPEKEGSPGCRR